MGRMIVSPPRAKELFGAWGISPAVRSGDLLFLGGQVGIRPDGSASSDPAEQMQQAFENMGAILDHAGASFNDIVDMTAFYTDYPAHSSLARPIREKFFGTDTPPNWTAMGVVALAEPFVFEVKGIARLPAG